MVPDPERGLHSIRLRSHLHCVGDVDRDADGSRRIGPGCCGLGW